MAAKPPPGEGAGAATASGAGRRARRARGREAHGPVAAGPRVESFPGGPPPARARLIEQVVFRAGCRRAPAGAGTPPSGLPKAGRPCAFRRRMPDARSSERRSRHDSRDRPKAWPAAKRSLPGADASESAVRLPGARTVLRTGPPDGSWMLPRTGKTLLTGQRSAVRMHPHSVAKHRPSCGFLPCHCSARRFKHPMDQGCAAWRIARTQRQQATRPAVADLRGARAANLLATLLGVAGFAAVRHLSGACAALGDAFRHRRLPASLAGGRKGACEDTRRFARRRPHAWLADCPRPRGIRLGRRAASLGVRAVSGTLFADPSAL